MSTIQEEIKRIKDNISDAYTSLSNKGATMPANKTSANLAQAIESIDTGNALVTYDSSKHTLVITVS